MKTLFFALVGIFLTNSVLFARPSKCCNQQPVFDATPNYVVIGAFAVHKNATRFTVNANRLSNQLKSKAEYQLNANRNLYYVYVLVTPNREEAINEANRLRSESQFPDTWVYHGSLGNLGENEPSTQGVDINPETEKKIESVSPSDNANVSSQSILNDTENLLSSSNANALPVTVTTGTGVNDGSVGVEPPSTGNSTLDDGVEGKRFLFSLYRAVDNAKVEGDVDVINTERAKKVGTYKGNTPVKISSPGSKTNEVTFVCEVFGYRKVQHSVNYNEPAGENISVDAEQNVVVPFELVRLQKGDIAVMYNVYFFKDAGVMRPESRFEVNSLMDMLKENPNYKIKLHGHTNGGAAGKIISMGESKNFFSLTGTKESMGSAKKLSEERTNVIKEYLVANGIEPSRMQLKAWGGKRPLHDKHSTRAQENVRVEVEILED